MESCDAIENRKLSMIDDFNDMVSQIDILLKFLMVVCDIKNQSTRAQFC